MVLSTLLSALSASQTDAPAKSGTKLRVVEVAARMADDEECERTVKTLSERSEASAWALVLACVEQDKYRDVKSLLGPWRRRFLALPREEQMRVVAHTIATAGAWYEPSLPVLRELQLPVRLLSAAVDSPRKKPDDYVVFRGRISERRLDKNGAIRLVIVERERLKPGDPEFVIERRTQRRYGYREDWRDGPRRVLAVLDEMPILPREGNEYAFLAVLQRVESDSKVEVRVIDLYKPGVDLEFLGR